MENKAVFEEVMKIMGATNGNVEEALEILEKITLEFKFTDMNNTKKIEISSLKDDVSLYVFKERKGFFNLENFLLNRIIRNTKDIYGKSNFKENFVSRIKIKKYIDSIKDFEILQIPNNFRTYFSYIEAVHKVLVKHKMTNLIKIEKINKNILEIEEKIVSRSINRGQRGEDKEVDVSSQAEIEAVIIESRKKVKSKEIREKIQNDNVLLSFEEESRKNQEKYPEGRNEKQIELELKRRKAKLKGTLDLNRILEEKRKTYILGELPEILFVNYKETNILIYENLKKLIHKIGVENIFDAIFLETDKIYLKFDEEFAENLEKLNLTDGTIYSLNKLIYILDTGKDEEIIDALDNLNKLFGILEITGNENKNKNHNHNLNLNINNPNNELNIDDINSESQILLDRIKELENEKKQIEEAQEKYIQQKNNELNLNNLENSNNLINEEQINKETNKQEEQQNKQKINEEKDKKINDLNNVNNVNNVNNLNIVQINLNCDIKTFIEEAIKNYLKIENTYQISRRNEDEEFHLDLMHNILKEDPEALKILKKPNGIYGKEDAKTLIRILIVAKEISIPGEVDWYEKCLESEIIQEIITKSSTHPYYTSLKNVSDLKGNTTRTEKTRLEKDKYNLDRYVNLLGDISEKISSYSKMVKQIKENSETSFAINLNIDSIVGKLKEKYKRQEDREIIIAGQIALLKILARNENMYPTEEKIEENIAKFSINKQYINYVRDELIQEVLNLLNIYAS